MARALLPIGMVAAALLSGLLVHFLLPHQIWIHVPLHSTVEALGGLAAVLMGLVLLARKVEWEDERLQGLASGLLGMGILEGFHAVSSPDQGFVLLRSAASLLGGVAFSFVWHPPGMIGKRTRDLIPYLVTGGTVVFGLFVVDRSSPTATIYHARAICAGCARRQWDRRPLIPRRCGGVLARGRPDRQGGTSAARDAGTAFRIGRSDVPVFRTLGQCVVGVAFRSTHRVRARVDLCEPRVRADGERHAGSAG